MPEYEDVTDFPRLLHPYPTCLITCCDGDGKANIISIGWMSPLSYHPPLVGLAVRRNRFSYPLITSTGEFVINVPTFEMAEEVLFCGRNSGSEVDKFAAAHLTPAPARCVHPPVILECVAYLECKLVNDVVTGDHDFLVGEVLAAYTRPGTLGRDGLKNLRQVLPLLHLGGDRFVTVRRRNRSPRHAG